MEGMSTVLMLDSEMTPSPWEQLHDVGAAHLIFMAPWWRYINFTSARAQCTAYRVWVKGLPVASSQGAKLLNEFEGLVRTHSHRLALFRLPPSVLKSVVKLLDLFLTSRRRKETAELSH